jgi:DNA-binding response OmpR family regulator
MADPQLILVVDDEPSYRDALSVALQREGFAAVSYTHLRAHET